MYHSVATTLVALAGIDLLKFDGRYTYETLNLLSSILRSFGLI
jgi:hypothetical protein